MEEHHVLGLQQLVGLDHRLHERGRVRHRDRGEGAHLVRVVARHGPGGGGAPVVPDDVGTAADLVDEGRDVGGERRQPVVAAPLRAGAGRNPRRSIASVR